MSRIKATHSSNLTTWEEGKKNSLSKMNIQKKKCENEKKWNEICMSDDYFTYSRCRHCIIVASY